MKKIPLALSLTYLLLVYHWIAIALLVSLAGYQKLDFVFDIIFDLALLRILLAIKPWGELTSKMKKSVRLIFTFVVSFVFGTTWGLIRFLGIFGKYSMEHFTILILLDVTILLVVYFKISKSFMSKALEKGGLLRA